AIIAMVRCDNLSEWPERIGSGWTYPAQAPGSASVSAAALHHASPGRAIHVACLASIFAPKFCRHPTHRRLDTTTEYPRHPRPMTETPSQSPLPANGLAAPLRIKVFRRIWIASLLSNLGLMIQSVGAAWAMTQMTSAADKVALVQTALMLPIMLISM